MDGAQRGRLESVAAFAPFICAQDMMRLVLNDLSCLRKNRVFVRQPNEGINPGHGATRSRVVEAAPPVGHVQGHDVAFDRIRTNDAVTHFISSQRDRALRDQLLSVSDDDRAARMLAHLIGGHHGFARPRGRVHPHIDRSRREMGLHLMMYFGLKGS